MTSNVRSLDFEIIKEPWNKYQISDNSVLKFRTILMKVKRTIENNKVSFTANVETLIIANADPSLKGAPNTGRPTDNAAESIDKKDMRYDTISQEFNEYVLDDGTKIKIYTNVTNIDRSRLRDADGDPIYNVNSSAHVEIRPSSRYGEPPFGR